MNNVSTSVSIHTMPTEILESIFSYTNYSPAIAAVCKDWYNISQNPQTILSLLKERKIRLGIEKVLEEGKHKEDKVQISEIQTLFLKRLRPTLLDPLISEEQFKLFSPIPPSITAILYFHELEQDLNLLKFFAAIEKQVKTPLIKPQVAGDAPGSVHQQANYIREILKLNETTLKTITKIDLSKHGMTIVPEELNLLTEVTFVSLANNNIHMLPANLGSAWVKLNEFYLSFNKIEHLPAEFGQQWKELKTLDLSHNNLTYLPDSFGTVWSKMTTFSLNHNKMASFSSEFGMTWSLIRSIKLHNNLLKELPEKFGANWKLLQYFEVQKNPSNIDANELKKQWPKISTCKPSVL